MEIINFAAETHQGPFLNVNEDGYKFDFENDLYMLFDGFGGNNVGDKVVAGLQSQIFSFFKNFVKDRNSTLPFYFSPKYLLEANALINAALNSHSALYQDNQAKPINERGGASAILAVKSDSILNILSTGNCRAYLVRRGQITTVVQGESFDLLSQDNYHSHLKNIPLSGFGLYQELHFQIKELRIARGDKVIFMSDGVYGRIDDGEINSGIIRPTINIKSKIAELFDLANSRGNLDNQTCMILEF